VSRIHKNPDKSKLNSILGHVGRTYKYIKHQELLLKTHPEFNEKWIQEK
jgi:hypothetical protein